MKTEKELLEIAMKIAKKGRFDGVEAVGIKWKGYNVFEMYFEPDEDGRPPCTGLPQYVLLDDEGNEYKEMLSYEETFEIMHLIPYEEDEPEDEEETKL